MDMVSVFSYFVLYIALYLFTNQLVQKIRNHPPGPFLSFPIIGHLYLLKRPLFRSLTKIAGRHGPVVLLRFGSRRVLAVSSPAAAEECLSKNDVVFANRPRLLFGKLLGYNYSSLAWAPYGDHWRNLRRIATVEILSTHRLQALSAVRSEEVAALVRRIARESERSPERTVGMNQALFELMLNVLMRMVAGKRYFGESAGEAEAEEARRFKRIVAETFDLAQTSSPVDFLPVLSWLGLGKLEKRMMALSRRRNQFMRELIEEHKRNNDKQQRTMIGDLLALQDKEPENYKDDMIISIPLTLLVAGTDTSVNTMEWALSLLLNHPHTLKKVQAEIDATVGRGRLLKESDLTSLPYLRCIINETLRMYPAGPLLVPHESSEETTIGGYSVPRGTMLFVNLWAIQNDPKLWDQPREFRPERFTGLEGQRDGFKLMPFGSGRRSCPGDGLAMRMVGLALGTMLQCFEWERVGEQMVDMEEGAALTLPRVNGLVAKCRIREGLLDVLSQI